MVSNLEGHPDGLLLGVGTRQSHHHPSIPIGMHWDIFALSVGMG